VPAVVGCEDVVPGFGECRNWWRRSGKSWMRRMLLCFWFLKGYGMVDELLGRRFEFLGRIERGGLGGGLFGGRLH
jgi:hypothetical protein